MSVNFKEIINQLNDFRNNKYHTLMNEKEDILYVEWAFYYLHNMNIDMAIEELNHIEHFDEIKELLIKLDC